MTDASVILKNLGKRSNNRIVAQIPTKLRLALRPDVNTSGTALSGFCLRRHPNLPTDFAYGLFVICNANCRHS